MHFKISITKVYYIEAETLEQAKFAASLPSLGQYHERKETVEQCREVDVPVDY